MHVYFDIAPCTIVVFAFDQVHVQGDGALDGLVHSYCWCISNILHIYAAVNGNDISFRISEMATY